MPAFIHVPCRRVVAEAEVLGKLLVVASSLLPAFVPFARLWIRDDGRAALPISCFHSSFKGRGSAGAAHVGIAVVSPFPSSETRLPLVAE